MTFSIRDLEGPYSYSEASESASSSDSETPHDDHSEAPNPESSTLPQDKPLSSQDGVIEQAQGDDGASWEDGRVTRQGDSEEVLKRLTKEKAYRRKAEPLKIMIAWKQPIAQCRQKLMPSQATAPTGRAATHSRASKQNKQRHSNWQRNRCSKQKDVRKKLRNQLPSKHCSKT